MITLTLEIEQALIEHAGQQGTTPEHLALETLRKQFVSTAAIEQQSKAKATLFDFLGSAIGILRSSEHVPDGAQMATDSNKKFIEALLKKREQGQL